MLKSQDIEQFYPSGPYFCFKLFDSESVDVEFDKDFRLGRAHIALIVRLDQLRLHDQLVLN